MNKKQASGVAGIGVAIIIALSGCGNYGETHDHNAPAPVGDKSLYWHRIATPGNYAGIIMTCDGTTGLYDSQSQGNLRVVPNDPACKGVDDRVPNNGGLAVVPSGEAVSAKEIAAP